MVELAAEELQAYIKKITGAELPISTEKSKDWPMQIYVGKSSYTQELGVKTDGLKDGAYRMVSGANWLVLIGRDDDFTPTEPWARDFSYNKDPQKTAEWDAMNQSKWGNNYAEGMYRAHRTGTGWWEADERGSLNAVYAFLRTLGVEWYMPGDLGEIIPHMASIALPKIDKSVSPVFGLRFHHQTPYFSAPTEDLMWYLRMGLNVSSEKTGMAMLLSHGMRTLHGRPEMKEEHPDYYALRGGKRATKENQPCLSSEGLFQEHLKYIRFLFDHYQLPMVSITPEDGAVYCECPLCAPKLTPKRGWVGGSSDYVWDYYNRIAKEIYKTHPAKLLVACSYANYLLPPEKIDKLSPNLVVGLVQQRKTYHDAETHKEDIEFRKMWQAKMGPQGKLIMWEHYPYTVPGRPAYGIPEYFPHQIAEDLHSLKGISIGEFVEVQFDAKTGAGMDSPGFNHLNSYVTSRYYWDADQDIDALLETYYSQFYGPAREEMKAFIEYCEKNWSDLKKDSAKIDQVFALMNKAQAKAPPDSVYGKRIELVANFIQPLKKIRKALSRNRTGVPELRISSHDDKIAIDGKLDEPRWQSLPGQGNLKEIVSGELPGHGAQIRLFLQDNALYIGIRCDDDDMQNLNIGTTKDKDEAIWTGDSIDILIETQNHSYYQIAVNPAGAKMDGEWVDGKFSVDWASEAQVATEIGDDYWTAELRIPIASEGSIDPLHDIVGSVPTPDIPWYFNICRTRIRGDEKEISAFSPTGVTNIHESAKFAKLYTGIPEEVMKEIEKRNKTQNPESNPTP